MGSSVKFSGALYNNRHTFQVAAQQLNRQAKQVTIDVAQMYEQSLWSMLNNGRAIWGEKDTAYYRRKKDMYLNKHGLADRGPWIKSGDLVSRIKTNISQDGGKRFRAWAGFEDGTHHSGLSVTQLVNRLDSDMPLIQPSWDRIEARANALMMTVGQGLFRNERGW